MDGKGLKTAIVIVNYNNYPDVVHCVDSLCGVEAEMEIIVVDNSSTDDSYEALKERLPGKVRLLRSEGNCGWSGGNNIGIRAALKNGADAVLLLNDDTEVTPGFLSRLLEVLNRGCNVGIVGARNMLFDRRDKPWMYGGLFDHRTFRVSQIESDGIETGKEYEVDYVPGSCMLVKRQVFDKVGLIDERFFFYGAALDFSLRARQKGFRSLYVPSAVIYHKVSVSFGDFNAPKNRYYWFRARFLLIKKHRGVVLAFLVMVKEMISETAGDVLTPVSAKKRGVLKSFFCRAAGIFDGMFSRFGLRNYGFF